MMLSAPWRLGLLFLISGVASSFMLGKTSPGTFMRLRSWRLLVPLVFGMLVIVPPQPYFEVVEKYAYQGSYLDFMQLYVHAYRGFVTGPNSHLILPTWNHLWFVAYLWVYTLALGVIVPVLGARFDAWSQRVADLLTGWKLVLLPLAVLGLVHLVLMDRYPSTHALFGDWYNHGLYFSLFLLGAMMARQADFWQRLDDMRWVGLGIALTCWAVLKIYFSLPDGVVPAAAMPWLDPLHHVVYALCQWSPIIAVCGFAHRHLEFDSAKRRYLAQAVFPVYIVHQTLIVAMAHGLKPVRLAPGIESILLMVLTVTFSFAIFEVVRRYAPLRPLFGLGMEDRRIPDKEKAASVSGAALAKPGA
jgi:hypothetical protein